MTKIPEKPYNNHQITLLLSSINDKLKVIDEKVTANANDDKTWRKSHEEDDKKIHNHLHERISGMKNYLMSVAVAAGLSGSFVGAFLTYIIKFLGGKV